MIDFVDTPPFLRIALQVAMETQVATATKHFHIAQTGLFIWIFFTFRGSQRTIWHQFKIVLGVQGRSN